MKEYFSVDEILDMAEQLERNGAAFYRLAVKEMAEPHMRTLLSDLATWEDEHEKIFARMRVALRGKVRSGKALDPKDKRFMQLLAMVDGNVFDLHRDPAQLLNGQETTEDILQVAVRREKDSVIFYLSLKNLLVNTADQKIIDEIIEEELDHITFLNKELTTLRHQLM
jgi:rubrerythrin